MPAETTIDEEVVVAAAEQVLNPIVDALTPLVDSLEPVIGALVPLVDSLQSVNSSLDSPDPSLSALVTSLNSLVTSLRSLVASLEPFARSGQPLAATLQPIVKALQPLIAAVGKALEPLVAAVKPWLDALTRPFAVLQPLVDALQPLVGSLEPLVIGLAPLVSALQPSDTTSDLREATPAAQHEAPRAPTGTTVPASASGGTGVPRATPADPVAVASSVRRTDSSVAALGAQARDVTTSFSSGVLVADRPGAALATADEAPAGPSRDPGQAPKLPALASSVAPASSANLMLGGLAVLLISLAWAVPRWSGRFHTVWTSWRPAPFLSLLEQPG